jgi:hypothetical protein
MVLIMTLINKIPIICKRIRLIPLVISLFIIPLSFTLQKSNMTTSLKTILKKMIKK